MSSPNYLKVSAPIEFTDALREYCKANDMPMSTLVRHAVREYLDRHTQVKNSNSQTLPYSACSIQQSADTLLADIKSESDLLSRLRLEGWGK